MSTRPSARRTQPSKPAPRKRTPAKSNGAARTSNGSKSSGTRARTKRPDRIPEPIVLESSRRFPLKRIVITVAVIVAVWAIVAGLQLWRTASDARAGMDHAERARAFGVSELVGEKGAPESEGTIELRAASERFEAAAKSAGSLVLAPVRVIPVVGRQVSALRTLSIAAGTVTGSGAQALADVRSAIAAADASSGPSRIALAKQVASTAGALAAHLDRVDLGSGSGLLWPISDAHRRATSEVEQVRSTMRATEAGASALAGLLQGPANYLLFAANNAEMRAGGGAPLRMGVLSTRDGRISMGPTIETSDLRLPGDGVAIDGDLARVWGWAHPNREWRNLGVTPRFPVTAELAARMWQVHSGGQIVDGVIQMDVVGLAELLHVTGSIEVQGRRLDEHNVVEYLTHGQYVEIGEYRARGEHQGAVATAVFGAIDSGDFEPARLVSAFGRAAAGRHLAVWSREPKLQDLWKRSGAAGELSENDVLVSVVSRGGNKLDKFLRVTADVERTGLEVTVRVTLENTVPIGEPQYVAGPHPSSGVGEGVYLGIATLQAPSYARGLAITDARTDVSGPDGPSQVIGTVVTIPRGGRQVITYRFTVPDERVLRMQPSARVPGIQWHLDEEVIRDDKSWSVVP
jgi:hypothetical protein